jgi:hypothetical protein
MARLDRKQEVSLREYDWTMGGRKGFRVGFLIASIRKSARRSSGTSLGKDGQ